MTAASDTIPEITFDPSSSEYTNDPYSFYRRLRAETPIARIGGNFLLVSRYRECVQILRAQDWNVPFNLNCVAQREGTDHDNQNFGGMRNLFENENSREVTAEQAHRSRFLVAKVFSRRTAAEMESRVRAFVNELLDQAIERQEVDFVESFTTPLVQEIGCSLMGIPSADRPMVRPWISELAGTIDPLYVKSPAQTERVVELGHMFRDYMTELLAARRKEPTDDLLSDLLAAEEGDDGVPGSSVVPMACIVTIGAADTTVNFLSLAIWSLLRHPAQRELFRNDWSLAYRAVEELLRYDAHIQFVSRVADRATELGGYRVEPGQYALVMTASANRDGSVFAEPEKLDLTRSDNPHLAFAPGRHYCSGAAFAREESQVALYTLLRRLPNLALAGEPVIRQRFNNRGLARLPVVVGEPSD